MKLSKRIFGLLALLFLGSASALADSEDPFGDFNSRLYQGNMTITGKVVMNETVITDALVAVYCEDVLRGKKAVGTGTPSDYVFLQVYGNNTGAKQNLYFKVYTGGHIYTYHPDPEIEWKYDGIVGSNSSPYIIDITPVSLANDADNSNVLLSYDTKTCDVVLTGRTLFKDGSWNTLCLPFGVTDGDTTDDITFSGTPFQGATLMELDTDGKNGFDTEDGTLYLCFKTATAIEAGVPYIVKWEKATDYKGNEASYDISNPVFEGVTISNSMVQTVESTTTGLETVQMMGTYSPVSVKADDKSILFLGDANTLYYSSIDRNIRSCRAYLSVPYISGHNGAETLAFVLDFDGEEETGIILTPGSSPMGEGSDYWYTIDGRKLSGKPTQRGMYINKGKKILVK